MEQPKTYLLFIVEDNALYSKMLGSFLKVELPSLEIKVFSNGEASLHEMHLNPFAVIMDYFLNSEFEYAWNGIQNLHKILQAYPESNIIIISGQQDMQTALNCLKEGAYQYIIKNDHAPQFIKSTLLDLIDDAVEL